MTIEAIEFIPPGMSLETISVTQKPETNFVNWLENEMSQSNELILKSEVELRKLATGETSNLHHVMMALDKANTSFQLVSQVRNKILDGYQEIMRMQV